MSSLSQPPGGDWDNDDAARYRRPRQPVEVRRPVLWKRVAGSAARVLLVVTIVVGIGGAGFFVHRFATTHALFRVANLDAVEVANTAHVPAAAVREQFVADVGDAGSSIFAIPLSARRQSLEEIPWVEAATVQRLLPNRLRVHIRERTPVAFFRQRDSLWLIDPQGVILPLPEGASYTFPVLTGLAESLSLGERRARVQLYVEFVGDLDRDGKNYTAQLSEIDLSAPDNLRATVTEADGAVWLHFGRGRYQEKFDTFLRHRSLWQQSGETVRSVDLRYRGQIVLNPDTPAESPSP